MAFRARSRLFTTYRLPGYWNRLLVGGGANWQSVDGPNGPQRMNQSSVMLLSTITRYAFDEQAWLQANTDNLLNRKSMRPPKSGSNGCYSRSPTRHPATM